MDQHTILLFLVLAWAIPPAITLFLVARSQRRHRGRQGDRDSLDEMREPSALLMLVAYWLICISAALVLFQIRN